MKFDFDLYNNNLNGLISKLKTIDPTIRHKVSVSEFKSKRTLDQNSRYWKLITEFGNFCGYDADEMHEEVGRRFLSYEKVMPNGEVKTFTKSTTKLKTDEMAELQDKIERIAAQQGFIFSE